MDIKLDVNKLVDKLANAERTVGEQGKTIANYEAVIRDLREELVDAKQGMKELNTVKDGLEKECNELKSNGDFWYKKACELGYKYKPMTNPENEGNNDGA